MQFAPSTALFAALIFSAPALSQVHTVEIDFPSMTPIEVDARTKAQIGVIGIALGTPIEDALPSFQKYFSGRSPTADTKTLSKFTSKHGVAVSIETKPFLSHLYDQRLTTKGALTVEERVDIFSATPTVGNRVYAMRHWFFYRAFDTSSVPTQADIDAEFAKKFGSPSLRTVSEIREDVRWWVYAKGQLITISEKDAAPFVQVPVGSDFSIFDAKYCNEMTAKFDVVLQAITYSDKGSSKIRSLKVEAMHAGMCSEAIRRANAVLDPALEKAEADLRNRPNKATAAPRR